MEAPLEDKSQCQESRIFLRTLEEKLIPGCQWERLGLQNNNSAAGVFWGWSVGSKGPQCCPRDMFPPPGVPWKGHRRHHGLDLTAVLLTRHKQGGVSQGIEGGFWGSGNFAAWMCWTQLWFYLSAGGTAQKSPSWRCEVLGRSPTAAMGKARVKGNKQETWQCIVGTCYLQYSPACGSLVPLWPCWPLGAWWWPCLPG